MDYPCVCKEHSGFHGGPQGALVGPGAPWMDPWDSCEVPGRPWPVHERFLEGSSGVLKSLEGSLDIPGEDLWES